MPYWFDGNNLIGQSAAAAKADSGTRKKFLSALSSFHRSGGGRFTVYFDGDDPDRAALPPGVAVRYSAPQSTDDAILYRLREIRHPAEVIVVTNDRALMLHTRNQGAKAMTWREFTLRMQSRSARGSSPTPREAPVNVDEWIEYFGLNRTKT